MTTVPDDIIEDDELFGADPGMTWDPETGEVEVLGAPLARPDQRQEPLANVDWGEINLDGGATGDPSRDLAFSAINRREQEIVMSMVFDFTRNFRVSEHRGRMIVGNLSDLGRDMLKAPGLLRKQQYAEMAKAVTGWTREMGRERERKELPKMVELLAGWARGNSAQQHLTCLRIQHGFGYLERMEPPIEHDDNGDVIPHRSGPRHDWHLADRRMKEADANAISELAPEPYQIYVCKKEQHQILREEAEDRARRIPNMDISAWMQRLTSGRKVPDVEIFINAPWVIQEAFIFAMNNHGKDNPFWDHLEKLQAGMHQQIQARRGWGFNRGGGQAAPGQPADGVNG